MNELPLDLEGPEEALTAQPKREWTTPTVDVFDTADAEVGLMDPAPEGTFGLS